MTPAEKLAQSLEMLQEQGVIAIRSGDLSRTHRERLLKHGFLQEVIKGWYIPSRPDETGEKLQLGITFPSHLRNSIA